MQKTCPVCGDSFVGRIDKKFCSDQCRNTYNNFLKKDEVNYVRRINHILRKNRRILAELNPDGKITIARHKLTDKGFNFNYFTNVYTTKAGKNYFFCYDHGYLPLENNHIALVIKQEYVE
ncbi:MAG: DUF2116 family Zn-ribbon domain-containing protein [Bacteroidetes bacterium]|jgi:predicted nucleic acid-binding Zn ribbon protein|nr:DUF2116 family Zn-ribbon domain-containing protein [Bacteroidota bacterium]